MVVLSLAVGKGFHFLRVRRDVLPPMQWKIVRPSVSERLWLHPVDISKESVERLLGER